MNLTEYHKIMNKSGNKYKAIKTEYNGVLYASKAEAKRAMELDLMEKDYLITDVQRQPKFPIVINGKTVFTYIADFSYFDEEKKQFIVEDVKGMRTPMFNLKKKCVEAQYGITIHLV